MGNNSSSLNKASRTNGNSPRQGEAPSQSAEASENNGERHKRSSRRAKRREGAATSPISASSSATPPPDAKRPKSTAAAEDSTVFAAARTIGKHVWEEAVTVCVPEGEATKLVQSDETAAVAVAAKAKPSQDKSLEKKSPAEPAAAEEESDEKPNATISIPAPKSKEDTDTSINTFQNDNGTSPPAVAAVTAAAAAPSPVATLPSPRANRTTQKRAAKPEKRKRTPVPLEEKGFKCPFCGVKGVVPVLAHAETCSIRMLKPVADDNGDGEDGDADDEDSTILSSPSSASKTLPSRNSLSSDDVSSSPASRSSPESRTSPRKRDKDSISTGDDDDDSSEDGSSDSSSGGSSDSDSSGSSSDDDSSSDSSDTTLSSDDSSDSCSTVNSSETTTSLEVSSDSSSSEDEKDSKNDRSHDRNSTLESVSSSVQESQLQYTSLARWLKELMDEDEDIAQYEHDDDQSILEYMEESGAPKPVAILAYYLHHHCPKVTDVLGIDNNNNQTNGSSERWRWFREHFPRRTGAFTCPRPPMLTANAHRHRRHRKGPLQLGMSPDYAVVASCTIWLLEWEILLQSAPPETAAAASLQQQPRRLKCTRCSEGHLTYDHLEKLIPVFGDCGTKPSWIVSNQYKCSSCGCTVGGSSSELLASLPRSLRRSYPSLISWISPECRFQVTRSLARRIDRTLRAKRPNGARKLEFFLLTQYDALYAAEELEFRARAKAAAATNSNNNINVEDFPPFREWLGEVDLPRAGEIEDLYRYATAGTG